MMSPREQVLQDEAKRAVKKKAVLEKERHLSILAAILYSSAGEDCESAVKTARAIMDVIQRKKR